MVQLDRAHLREQLMRIKLKYLLLYGQLAKIILILMYLEQEPRAWDIQAIFNTAKEKLLKDIWSKPLPPNPQLYSDSFWVQNSTETQLGMTS